MAQYLDGIQSVEGRVTLPKLIGTFNYSEFVASATTTKLFRNVLTRNVRRRTLVIASSISGLGSNGNVSCSVFDSTILTNNNAGSAVSTGYPLYSNNSVVATSDTVPMLGANLDSVQVSIPWGTTLPTSGKVEVYVVEYF